MLATTFVSWWYGAGWKLVAHSVSRRLDRTLASFSVPTLARTMFAPWKRIVAVPGAGIEAHFRAMIDNLISRLVGFTVRLFVLLAATLSLGVIAAVGAVQVVLWPLVPPLVVFCVVRGLS